MEDIKIVDIPLKSYLTTQHQAMLSEEKKAILNTWIENGMVQMEVKNPGLLSYLRSKGNKL